MESLNSFTLFLRERKCTGYPKIYLVIHGWMKYDELMSNLLSFVSIPFIIAFYRTLLNLNFIDAFSNTITLTVFY